MAAYDSGTGATGVDAWASYTEYGTPKQAVSQTLGATTGIGYGWLGTKERATTETGLVLMGARLYNAKTGAFVTQDKIYGGNPTSYDYAVDPVNSCDLTGYFSIRFFNFWASGIHWRGLEIRLSRRETRYARNGYLNLRVIAWLVEQYYSVDIWPVLDSMGGWVTRAADWAYSMGLRLGLVVAYGTRRLWYGTYRYLRIGGYAY